jgi:predicted DCC family thiol-disulfide oxidoreductase YuxK
MASTDTDAATEARKASGADRDEAAAAAVFYDGGCPVCAREVNLYRGMEGGEGVEWIDVDDRANRDRLPEGLDRETMVNRFTVRRRDGRLATGAAAFLAMWRGLPRMRRLAIALDRTPLRQIAEGGYRLFLLVRPLWRRPD